MPANSVQANLVALQRLVAFAEGETNAFPVLVLRTGNGLVTAASSALKQVAQLTQPEISRLQLELQYFLRAVPTGNARMIMPKHVTVTIVTHQPDTPPRGRGAHARAASMLIEGAPRDVLFEQTTLVLLNSAIEPLQICPGCGKAFVKVTQKRFCSTRCQTRIYKRKKRAEERAEREQFNHGKTTRSRRGQHSGTQRRPVGGPRRSRSRS